MQFIPRRLPWRTQCKQMLCASLLISLAASPWSGPVMAEETQDNILDIQEPPETYGQPYLPYPPQMAVPVQTQPVKAPWYKRLFGRMVQNPPIQQAPKAPKETPRELPSVPEPLIRLAKGVAYEGTSLQPGFYLVRLRSEASGARLVLTRQQQEVLSVPAIALTMTATVQDQETQADDPAPQKAGKTRNTSKTAPSATGSVELAQDGNTLILTYRENGNAYTSVPLTISDPWQP